VFDFAGPALAGLDRSSGVTPDTDLPKGAIVSAVAYPVARSEGLWRVMLDVRAKDLTQPQFRLFLKRGKTALSETVIKALETGGQS
jgi:glucans biosynthesis protein